MAKITLEKLLYNFCKIKIVLDNTVNIAFQTRESNSYRNRAMIVKFKN